MKKTLKKSMAIILATLMLLTAAPLAGFVGLELPDTGINLTADASEMIVQSGTCGDNLTWIFSNGMLTISGTGDMENYDYCSAPWYSLHEHIKKVVVENGVKSIGDCAFSGCASLTSAILPDGVISIGRLAFSECENLEELIIPDSVSNIGEAAIYRCNSLASITIPAGVSYIGDNVFDFCNSLEGINVDLNNANYSSDECGVLFNKDKTMLIRYPAGNAKTTYIIPDSVKNIGYMAFSGCGILTSVTIPYTMTSIDDNAFKNFSGLKDITIPTSVTSIGEMAFENSGIESIIIPNSVTSIGMGAFRYCDNLANITIPDTLTNIGWSAFFDTACYNNESNWDDDILYIDHHLIESENNTVSGAYSIRPGTKTITNLAFSNCSDLTSIDIPDSVTHIGMGAFRFCTALSEVTFGENSKVSEIGYLAFGGCISLPAFTVPESAENICAVDGVLFSKDKKTLFCYPGGKQSSSFEISADITSVETGALAGCVGLGEITVADGNTKYVAENGALYIKDKTVLLAYPAGKTDSTFRIANGVEAIDDGAFGAAIALTTLQAPDTIKAIDDYAFLRCDNLTDIYYAGSPVDMMAIAIGENNASLTNANIHFNCCLHYETEIIPGTAATCTENGLSDGLKCASCQQVMTEQTTITATGHAPSADATCTEDQTCTVCGEVLTDKLGHDYDAAITVPTCEDDGYTTYTCANCGDTYVADEVGALGHNYVGTVTTNPTCTEDGVKTYVCSNDASHTYSEPVAKLGHDWGDWETVTVATCDTDGLAKRACKNDANHVEEKVLPANGHSDADNNDICDNCSISLNTDSEKPDDSSDFFTKLKNFFKSIIDFFKNLFSIN